MQSKHKERKFWYLSIILFKKRNSKWKKFTDPFASPPRLGLYLVEFFFKPKKIKVHNVCLIKNRSRLKTVFVTLLWPFWQILISYCKFLMSRPFKWDILGICTIIVSKDIHKNLWKYFFKDSPESIFFFQICTLWCNF